MDDLKDLRLGPDVDPPGGLIHQQDRRPGHEPLRDDHLLLVAAGQGEDGKVFIRHFDVQVPDLSVNGLFLRGIVHQEPPGKVHQGREGGVLADIQALHQSLALAILRHKGKTGLKLAGDTLDLHGTPLIEHRAGVLRPHPHQALHQLAAPRPQQAVNAQHLALFEVQAHVVQQPPAARLGQAQMFHLQHLLRPVQVHAALKAVVLRVLPHHVFHDPGQVHVLHVRVGHVLAVPQDGHVVPDLHDLLQPVGDIDDGEALVDELAHDFEQHLHLRCGQGGCGLVHNQDLQVIFNQVARDLHHLLLPHAEVAHHRLRRNFMLKAAKDGLCSLDMFFVVKEGAVCPLVAHIDVLINGKVGEQAQLLVDNADSPCAGVVGVPEGHLLALHIHFPGGGLLNAGDHLHQGGFARPVLANEHVDLTPQQVKGDLVQSLRAGIYLVNFLAVEHHIGIVKHVRLSCYSIVMVTGVMLISLPEAVAAPVRLMVFPLTLSPRARGTTAFSCSWLFRALAY